MLIATPGKRLPLDRAIALGLCEPGEFRTEWVPDAAPLPPHEGGRAEPVVAAEPEPVADPLADAWAAVDAHRAAGDPEPGAGPDTDNEAADEAHEAADAKSVTAPENKARIATSNKGRNGRGR